MMNRPNRSLLTITLILIAALALGQVLSYLFNPDSWRAFITRLPVILSMIFFWSPIMALISGGFVWAVMRLLGFHSLEAIRYESVEQNNPAPAIAFAGALIAAMLFLMLVIRP